MIEITDINSAAAAIGIIILALKNGEEIQLDEGEIKLSRDAIEKFHLENALIFTATSNEVDDSYLVESNNIDRVSFRVDPLKKQDEVVPNLPTCPRCGSSDIDEGTSRCLKCGEPRAI